MKFKLFAITLSSCYLVSCAGFKQAFNPSGIDSSSFNPLSSPSSKKRMQDQQNGQEQENQVPIEPLPTDKNTKSAPPSLSNHFKSGEVVLPMLPNIGFFNNKPNTASTPDSQIPAKEKLTVIDSDDTYTRVSRRSGKSGYVLTITIDRAESVATMPPVAAGPLPSENSGNTVLGTDLVPVIDPAAAPKAPEPSKNVIENPAAVVQQHSSAPMLEPTATPPADKLLNQISNPPAAPPTEKAAVIVKPALDKMVKPITSPSDDQKLLDEVKGTLKK